MPLVFLYIAVATIIAVLFAVFLSCCLCGGRRVDDHIYAFETNDQSGVYVSSTKGKFLLTSPPYKTRIGSNMPHFYTQRGTNGLVAIHINNDQGVLNFVKGEKRIGAGFVDGLLIMTDIDEQVDAYNSSGEIVFTVFPNKEDYSYQDEYATPVRLDKQYHRINFRG